MKIIFVFIDGFGIGSEDPGKNPVYAAGQNLFDIFNESYSVIPTDAALGIPGLPQSATGQTAIYTGVNAAAAAGRHVNAQPTALLREIICSRNIFGALMERGKTVTNANVYRKPYLERMFASEKRHKPSVTSVMTMCTASRFRTVDDFRAGTGLYHDITGKMLLEHGEDITPVTPREAADNLYRISRDYDFTLFEHFLTDIIGHSMDMGMAIAEMTLLAEFFKRLVPLASEDALIVTGDHGNIEDMSVKTHTFNKVPTFIRKSLCMGEDISISSLTDIFPAILKLSEK